jgi:hypothetical protein
MTETAFANSFVFSGSLELLARNGQMAYCTFKSCQPNLCDLDGQR